jgi:hypothetical protein
MADRIAVCYFGHLRTFDLNYTNHIKRLRGFNYDLHMHTWSMSDITDSWHKLNDESRENTESYLRRLPSQFVESIKTLNIETQDEILNSKYINVCDHTSTLKNVCLGHQYHLWRSIVSVFEQAINFSKINKFEYKYFLFIRPDLRINVNVPEVHVEREVFYFPWPTSQFDLDKLKLWDVFFIVDSSLLASFKLINSNILDQSVEFINFNGYHSLKTLVNNKVEIKAIVGDLYHSIDIVRRPKGFINKIKAWYFFVFRK